MTSTDMNNIDGLLQDHFRKEMPQPWPAFRGQGAHLKQTTATPGRAVLALAAAALLGVGLWLNTGTQAGPRVNAETSPSLLNGATADGKDLLAPKPPMPPMGEEMPIR